MPSVRILRGNIVMIGLMCVLSSVPAHADGKRPRCSLQVNPSSGNAPLTVAATGSCDGNPQSVALDWGDGNSDNVNADFAGAHTYNNPGTFVVTVTATNDQGDSGSQSETVTVNTPPSSLVCAPTVSASSGQAPLTVTVTANCTDSGAQLTSTLIAFRDGYFQSGATASHTYSTAGDFSIIVSARDNSGNSTSANVGVSVSAAPFVYAGINNGTVKVFGKDGSTVATVNTNKGGSTTGMGFDVLGNLYVTDFTAGAASKIAGGKLVGNFGGGYNCRPESIVFDKAGNAYVGEAGCSHAILKFDAYGNLMATFQPTTESEGTDWVDLAADQCTLYYTSEGKSVLRFNACSGQQLTPLTSSLQKALAVRILPDGGALVANLQNIVRLDSSGNNIKTYDQPGEDCWSALTLDSDGSSFWAADFCTSDIIRFDISAGNQIFKFNTGTPTQTVFGVGTMGAITPPSPAGVFLASPQTATVARGQTASYALNFSPNDSGSGQNFSFNCTNLPAGAKCSFSPSSVTANSSLTTNLTISTTASSASLAPFMKRNIAWYAFILPLFGMVLLSSTSRRKIFRDRVSRETIIVMTMLALIVFVVSCGGGGSTGTTGGPGSGNTTVPTVVNGTPSGTYTVLVHAVSGALHSSTAIQLSVQ